MKYDRVYFIGWQVDEFERPQFPLFNVVGGKLDGRTLSHKGLQEFGIEVPKYPKPGEAYCKICGRLDVVTENCDCCVETCSTTLCFCLKTRKAA